MRAMLLATVLAITVQDPAEEAIRALCRTLGSDDTEARAGAARELIAKGRPALKPVRELLTSSNAEVRGQAQGILDAIRRELRKNALKLTVAPDKARYLPDEEITLQATLTVEDFPVVVHKFIYDGGICPKSSITVTSAGKHVPFAGDPRRQVIAHGKVDERRFLTIRPGESAVVRSVSFSHTWDLQGNDGSLKASYAKACTVPLAPGPYEVKTIYAFQHVEEPLLELGFGRELEFAGDSKRLFEESWKGSLQAETRFEVIQPSK